MNNLNHKSVANIPRELEKKCGDRGVEIFDDFDVFRESLNGWDTDPVQLGRGKLKIEYDFLKFDDMSLARMRTNRLLTDNCAQQEGWYHFVVSHSAYVFCGSEIPPGSMVVYGPGREYRNVIPEGRRALELGVSEALLRDRNIPIPDFAILTPENSVMQLTPETISEANCFEEELVRHIKFNQTEAYDYLATAMLRERALNFLECVLLEGNWPAKSKSCIGQVNRFELTLAALDLINQSDQEIQKISDISDRLGVSPRVLQYAFKDAGLCGPSQYLIALRLNKARRDLVAPRCSANSVTRSAMDNGRYHLGRFSEQYRKLFGELPSQTLKRAETL